MGNVAALAIHFIYVTRYIVLHDLLQIYRGKLVY